MKTRPPLPFAPLLLLLFTGATSTVLTGCRPAGSTESATPEPLVTHVAAATPVEAGRYLVLIGGCNDCHTAGYPESNGATPESEWLTGVPVGFRGPWGTSYAQNLRLRVQDLTEDAWVEMVHSRTALPPMPWPSLNHMSEADARAIYQYIKSLGPKGEPQPAAVPPGQEPETPYFDFEPQHMERLPAPAPAPTS